MSNVMQGIKLAIRQLRKSPVFTAVAVLTLALGIGANTAVFTLFDQALVRALPVQRPQELVRLRFTGIAPGHTNSYGGDDTDFFSYPMYRDLQDRNAVFSGVIANDEQSVGLAWKGRSEVEDCELVSGNYFEVLGVRPAIGRLLVPGDEDANRNSVVVLSFDAWKTKFASDPQVLNQGLLINTQPFTIVGVAPPEFHSVVAGQMPDVFVPITTKNIITPRWQDLEDRQSHWLTIAARLKPGVSRSQAEAGMQPLWHGIRAAELEQFGYKSPRTRRLFLDESRIQVLDNARGFSPLRDQIRTPLLIVMSMVGLLMLMACVNLSSLLLVRAAGRGREMAVRYALGAERWQIARQLLVEGLLLGVAGGLAALVVAPMISRVLVQAIFPASDGSIPFSTMPDARILAFNFAVAIAVSVLFSLAPVVRFLRPDLTGSLKQQNATANASPLRFRRLSVGVQIGLSLLLLFGAGLFVRTLQNLRAVNPGFAGDHLLTFGMNARLAGYSTNELQPLNRRVLERLAALPGVRSVAATDDPDLANDDETGSIWVPGYHASEEENMDVEEPWITPAYFATMQVPLLAGRTFSEQDTPQSAQVAIVNRSFANHFFGSVENALGRTVGFGARSDRRGEVAIVGVVGDTKHSGLRDPVRKTVYRPMFQSPTLNHIEYVMRTWQSPAAAENEVRAAMQQLDSRLAIGGIRTMQERIDDNLANDRLIALLSASFGVIAVLLAAIGLYGVLAYATAQRTREIGIRMALGAQRTTVMRLVLKDVLWLAGVSIGITVPISLLLARTLRSQLFGISPSDPLTLAVGALLVAAVALGAALLPARRAARVEPIEALRSE